MMESQAISGFLNVLKPPGMTSSAVVGYVRHLLGGAKVGHAGTLDPEAAGVLPLMVGKATRLFDYMQDKEKAYVGEVAFGAATDTQDAQGTVVQTGDRYPDERAIIAGLESFVGEQKQRPSAYSAIKQNGRKLYELARRGEQVDVPQRDVTVWSIEYRGLTPDHGALFAVRCSKGFYVRSLCNDLGERLGCPAHMRFLLRTQSGAFGIETAVTLEALAGAAERGALPTMLLPPKAALGHLPDADVPRDLQKQFFNGVHLPFERFHALAGTPAEHGAPACLWFGGELCAIAERGKDGLKLRTWLGENTSEGANHADHT